VKLGRRGGKGVSLPAKKGGSGKHFSAVCRSRKVREKGWSFFTETLGAKRREPNGKGGKGFSEGNRGPGAKGW